MLYPPVNCVFDSEKDIVNYIMKGVPPKKEQIQYVLQSIGNNGNVTINFDPSYDPEMFQDLMMEVYHNTVMIKSIGLAASILSGLLGFKLGSMRR